MLKCALAAAAIAVLLSACGDQVKLAALATSATEDTTPFGGRT